MMKGGEGRVFRPAPPKCLNCGGRVTCYCGTPLLHAPTPRPGENEKGKCPVCSPPPPPSGRPSLITEHPYDSGSSYGREGEEAGKGPVATRSVATQTEEEEEDFAMMTGSGNLDYDVVNVSAGEESQSESLDAVADTPPQVEEEECTD